MPIRQDDNRPSRRFGVINLVLIGFGVLLLFSNVLPNPGMQVPRVPYSLFIDEVNGDNVRRAYITSDQIRYELKEAPAEGPIEPLSTSRPKDSMRSISAWMCAPLAGSGASWGLRSQ